MKIYSIIILTMLHYTLYSQELFVMTEPASNMPANSFGIRAMNSFMYEKDNTLNYHIMPELMWGISHKWMVHLQSFHSNRIGGGIKTEGMSIYTKYRFLSIDDFHSHYRMAMYGRYSINNADIHQEEIETMGHNTGMELGMVATQLLHKTALSSTIAYERVSDNGNYEFPNNQGNEAINYTVSVGRLIYPKKYKSFKETNINIMCEFLGQKLLSNGKHNIDIVPSIQFIFNSQARIDIGYRKELYSNMLRTAPNGIIVKFEYLFFNI